MALQILNQPSWQSLTGQALGQGLGAGLSGLLDQLVSQKQQAQQKQGIAKLLQEKYNYSPEQALAAADQPEGIIRDLFKIGQKEQEGMGYQQLLSQLYNRQPQFPSSTNPEQTEIGTTTKVSPAPVSRQAVKEYIDIEQKERKLGMQEKKDIRQSWQDYNKALEKSRDTYKSAEERLDTINEMQELNQKGDLPHPALVKLLQTVGLGEAFWLGPESEEYQSLIKDFLADAKNLFGSRVTEFEIRQLLSAIPTLMNSQEGKERILNKFKRLQQARVAEYQAMSEVKKKFAGKEAPDDFYDRVDKKKKKKMDALYKDIFGDIQQAESTAPDLSTIEPNTVYQNPDTGKFGRLENGQWKEYDYNPDQNPYGALYGMGKS